MTRLTRFFPDIRDGKNFLIPWRRGASTPTPAVATFTHAAFTHAANGRARAANRAANKRSRASRKRNRV